MRTTKEVVLDLLTDNGSMLTIEIERAVSWWRQPFVLGSLISLLQRRMVEVEVAMREDGAHHEWRISTAGRQHLIERKKKYVPFWQRSVDHG